MDDPASQYDLHGRSDRDHLGMLIFIFWVSELKKVQVFTFHGHSPRAASTCPTCLEANYSRDNATQSTQPISGPPNKNL